MDSIRSTIPDPFMSWKDPSTPLSWKIVLLMCGSDVGGGSFDRSDSVWVFDNEPRNREIVSRIQGMYRQRREGSYMSHQPGGEGPK